jgi:hypothetical protein
VGTCTVFKRIGNISQVTLGLAPVGLDAGASLTGVKPDNSTVNLTKVAGATNQYSFTLASGSTRTLQPGTYRLNGTGGADVGAFSAQVTVPSFTWTNKSAVTVVNRNVALTVNWTGGGTGLVTINGFSGRAISGTSTNATFDATGFVCVAQASAGTFTVPTSVLQQLPAANFDLTAALGSNFSVGVLGVVASTDGNTGKFTAPLVRGGTVDQSIFGYALGDTKLLSIQ